MTILFLFIYVYYLNMFKMYKFIILVMSFLCATSNESEYFYIPRFSLFLIPTSFILYRNEEKLQDFRDIIIT